MRVVAEWVRKAYASPRCGQTGRGLLAIEGAKVNGSASSAPSHHQPFLSGRRRPGPVGGPGQGHCAILGFGLHFGLMEPSYVLKALVSRMTWPTVV